MSDGSPHLEYLTGCCRTDGTRRGASGGHAVLDVFAGTWDARSLFWIRPGEKPLESTGTMSSQWILGERYLQQRYVGAQMFDQEYAGCGIWGFNSTTGAYECVWCDTAACMILFERGSFDEDKKVYIADSSFISPTTGQIMRRRSVVTVRSNDEHVLETYLGPEPDADELLQANESGSNPFESAPEVLRVSSLDDTFDAPKVMEIRFSRRS